jgi:hypothetical protein
MLVSQSQVVGVEDCSHLIELVAEEGGRNWTQIPEEGVVVAGYLGEVLVVLQGVEVEGSREGVGERMGAMVEVLALEAGVDDQMGLLEVEALSYLLAVMTDLDPL